LARSRKISLGGILSVANAVGWLVVFIAPDYVFIRFIALALSVPLAMIIVPPVMDGPPYGGIPGCLLIGVNSFVWGYGVSLIWSNGVRRGSLRSKR
jgi:hypothetical protein